MLTYCIHWLAPEIVLEYFPYRRFWKNVRIVFYRRDVVEHETVEERVRVNAECKEPYRSVANLVFSWNLHL